MSRPQGQQRRNKTGRKPLDLGTHAVHTKANALQHGRKIGYVSDYKVLDFNAALGGPCSWRLLTIKRLGRELGVL